MDNTKINFLDILILLAKSKKFIIIFTLLMSVIAVAYSLLVTERWSSEFTVYPLADMAPLSMAQNLMEGLGIGTQSATARVMNLKNSAILKSLTNTENTIRKYNLIDYFEISEQDSLKAMDKAVRQFHSKMFDVLINDEVQFMTVRLTTKDRHFSREIAQHYLDLLSNYAQYNSNNTGRQRRELLETRVNEITNEMLALAEELKDFQTEHNILEIEEQVKAAIESYGLVLQELLATEVELSYVEKVMPNSIPYKNLVDKRIGILETLKKIETGYGGMPFLLSLDDVNDKIFTVQEKIFGLELYQRILVVISPQLELARIEEVNDMDRLEVIDLPNLPGRRAFPHRAMICVFTFFISFLFASMWVIVRELSSEEDKRKLAMFWNQIFSKKK